MKKELVISCALAFAGIIWIMMLLLNSPKNSFSTTSIPQPPQGQAGQAISFAQVSTHNSAGDCWIIVENKVYDVTQYLTDHPGGARTIIPTCGTDATQAYNTKNENKPHSSNAHQLLQNYYVGDLKL